jgi:hypothetical protein
MLGQGGLMRSSNVIGANPHVAAPSMMVYPSGFRDHSGLTTGPLDSVRSFFGHPERDQPYSAEERSRPWETLQEEFDRRAPEYREMIVNSILEEPTWVKEAFTTFERPDLQSMEATLIQADVSAPARMVGMVAVPRLGYTMEKISSSVNQFGIGFTMDEPLLNMPSGYGKRIFDMMTTAMSNSVIILEILKAHRTIQSVSATISGVVANRAMYTSYEQRAFAVEQKTGALQTKRNGEVDIVQEAISAMAAKGRRPAMMVVDPEAQSNMSLATSYHFDHDKSGGARAYQFGSKAVMDAVGIDIHSDNALVFKGAGENEKNLMRRMKQFGVYFVSSNKYLNCRDVAHNGSRKRCNTRCHRAVVYPNFTGGGVRNETITSDQLIDNCICFDKSDTHRHLNRSMYENLLANNEYQRVAQDIGMDVPVHNGQPVIDTFVSVGPNGSRSVASYVGEMSLRDMDDDFVSEFAADGLDFLEERVGKEAIEAFRTLLAMMDATYDANIARGEMDAIRAFWDDLIRTAYNPRTGFFNGPVPVGGVVPDLANLADANRNTPLPLGFGNPVAVYGLLAMANPANVLGANNMNNLPAVRTGVAAFERIYDALRPVFSPDYAPNLFMDASMAPDYVSSTDKEMRRRYALFAHFSRHKAGMVRTAAGAGAAGAGAVAAAGLGARTFVGFQEWVRNNNFASPADKKVAEDILVNFQATTDRMGKGKEPVVNPWNARADNDFGTAWEDLNAIRYTYAQQFVLAKKIYEMARGKERKALDGAYLTKLVNDNIKVGDVDLVPALDETYTYPLTINPDNWGNFGQGAFGADDRWVPASIYGGNAPLYVEADDNRDRKGKSVKFSRAHAGSSLGKRPAGGFDGRLQFDQHHREREIEESEYRPQAERREDGFGNRWDDNLGLRDVVHNSLHFGSRMTQLMRDISDPIQRAMAYVLLGSNICGDLFKIWARHNLPIPMSFLVIAPNVTFETSCAYFLTRNTGVMGYHADAVTVSVNKNIRVVDVNLFWFLSCMVPDPSSIYIIPDVYIHQMLGGLTPSFINNRNGSHFGGSSDDMYDRFDEHNPANNLIVLHMGPSICEEHLSSIISSSVVFGPKSVMSANYADGKGMNNALIPNGLVYSLATGMDRNNDRAIGRSGIDGYLTYVDPDGFNPMTWRGNQCYYNPQSHCWDRFEEGVGPATFICKAGKNVLMPYTTGILEKENPNALLR